MNQRLKNFIKNSLARVLRDGWTPELLAQLMSEYEALAQSSVLSMTPRATLNPMVAMFQSEIANDKILKRHPDISRVTFDMIQPQFRQILNDRIHANIDLIVLDRANSIGVSTRRFGDWLVNTQPLQGKVDMKPIYSNVGKPIEQVKFEEARRAIDQGHKMSRAIDETLAEQSGAIAAIWNGNVKTKTYDARPEHTERDGKIFVYRGGWAATDGLIKKGDNDWIEDLEDPPAHLINCTCKFQYVYSLRKLYRLAPELFTKKGLDYMGIKQ
jgi:hypothetical protein